MQYYEIFDLGREPFSNSPDPDFFFESEGHRQVLHNLEIALRLRRGLNVVMGEVGTGKTTLCRRLLRELADDPKFEAHLMLDPATGGARGFLTALRERLAPGAAAADGPDGPDERRLREDLQDALFAKGVDQELTVVLIVDEAQKISAGALEALRELLNYETNDSKLLQVVLFAQNEIQEALDAAPNLADRVNGLFRLGPLGLAETRTLVRHRLRCAASGRAPGELFSALGYRELQRQTGGYPRRIIRLCHKVMLALIMQDRRRAGRALVRACAREDRTGERRAPRRAGLAWAVAVVAVAVGAVAVLRPGWLPVPQGWPGAARDAAWDVAVQAAPASPAPQAPSAPSVLAGPTPAEAAPVPVARPTAPAPAPAPAAAPDDGALELLGSVRVGPGESISGIMIGVYGAYASRLMPRIEAANPDLADPALVVVGTRVAVPRQHDGTARLRRRAWLQLAGAPSLGEAWTLRRAARARGLDARVLPWWDVAGVGHFAVALDELFTGPGEAERALARLEPELGARLRVVEGSVFLPPR